METDHLQTVMYRTLKLFCYIVRMSDIRKMNAVIMVIMNGANKRGRTRNERLENIHDWCRQEVWSLVRLARDRDQWRQTEKVAVDTYGLSPKGL